MEVSAAVKSRQNNLGTFLPIYGRHSQQSVLKEAWVPAVGHHRAQWVSVVLALRSALWSILSKGDYQEATQTKHFM